MKKGGQKPVDPDSQTQWSANDGGDLTAQLTIGQTDNDPDPDGPVTDPIVTVNPDSNPVELWPDPAQMTQLLTRTH